MAKEPSFSPGDVDILPMASLRRVPNKAKVPIVAVQDGGITAEFGNLRMTHSLPEIGSRASVGEGVENMDQDQAKVLGKFLLDAKANMKKSAKKKNVKKEPEKPMKKLRKPFHAYQKKDVDTALKKVEAVAVDCFLDGHNNKLPNMTGISSAGKISPSVFSDQLKRNLNVND